MQITKDTIKDVCYHEVKNEWLAANTSRPLFQDVISSKIKMQNERYLKQTIQDFQTTLKAHSKNPFKRRKWKKSMLQQINEILFEETIIGLHLSTDKQTIQEIYNEVNAFYKQVRKFSPELSLSETGQAIRNYIVYVIFNKLHNKKLVFNMAAFGYSMLYPYTDNYIDSNTNTNQEKSEYNQMIRNKIKGLPVHPVHMHHKKTCELLQAIESKYPRDKYPLASILLLMMLEAQEDSLNQQTSSFVLSMEQRLDISVYKGGISVLIDRFFVEKELSKADLIFYLSFGFVLQLADDLQDIKEDTINRNQTIFTYDTNNIQEELLVNQLLQFTQHIFNEFDVENNRFKEFLLSNTNQLIYTSVLKSKEFFSDEYLSWLEQYLPVSITYYEATKENLVNHTGDDTYKKVLFELIS